ncbi:hypothetical protein JCM8097_008334 [Rhodosporidiobolus ruineniae]
MWLPQWLRPKPLLVDPPVGRITTDRGNVLAMKQFNLSFTIDWTVTNLASLFAERPGRQEDQSRFVRLLRSQYSGMMLTSGTIQSPPFLLDQWQLEFRVCSYTDGDIALLLHYQGPELRGQQPDLQTQFQSSVRVAQTSREAIFGAVDAVVVKCTLWFRDPPVLTPPYSTDPLNAAFSALRSAYSDLFESPSLSDVVFTFPNDRHPRSRYILVSKELISRRSSYFRTMLSPEWTEGTSDLSSSRAPAGSDRRTSSVPVSPWADDDDGLEWLPEGWLDLHGPDGERVAEKDFEEVPMGEEKRLLNIKITSPGYITYRAMLFFLYTERIEFTPPASDFTVALLAHHPDTTAPTTPSAPHASLEPTAGTSQPDFSNRRAWLGEQVPPRMEEKVAPASARAIYALADQLEIEELKARANEGVVAGFTVENIMYELVSASSRTYPELKAEALKFARANWSQVQKTAASRRVRAHPEAIEGGAEILNELFDGLAEVRE